jgi:N-acyl-D-aspartate/D-glutamate deacylase
MGKAEVEAFLTSLAVERHVAVATQRAAAWMKRAATRDVLTVTSPYSAALHTGYQPPAGGKRMIAEARGVDCTIVNGRLVFDHGRHTGALPGVAVN